MADVSDRDIQATALLAIKEHGQLAVFYAAGRADELLEQGVVAGSMTWRALPPPWGRPRGSWAT